MNRGSQDTKTIPLKSNFLLLVRINENDRKLEKIEKKVNYK